MASSHGASLYRPGSSVVHRLPAAGKLVAHVTFMLVVVATPPVWIWAFAAYAAQLAVIVRLAGIPAQVVLRRMVVEIPFVIFALLLPIVSDGPRREVLGASLSEAGLASGWNILVKGTIGVVASILLATTTPTPSLLHGLRVLRLPDRLVDVASFMVRYLGVVGAEMSRMRIARESRGFEARHLGHVRVVAHSAGALFVRTYERGERVHLAMLSRGGGSLATATGSRQSPGELAAAASVPGVALAVLVTAWLWS